MTKTWPNIISSEIEISFSYSLRFPIFPYLTIFMVFVNFDQFYKVFLIVQGGDLNHKNEILALVEFNSLPAQKWQEWTLRSDHWPLWVFKALGRTQAKFYETVSTNISDSEYNLWRVKWNYYRVSFRIICPGSIFSS